MKKKLPSSNPQINNQSYANMYKNNMKKENKIISNNDIDKTSNKINMKNNSGLNFDKINDWGNIVYPNEQNINEYINKLNIGHNPENKNDNSQNEN